MSQIYFTSSYIASKRALSLEELSSYIDLSEIVLVFDTNLVVDYRDFFLSTQRFINNKRDVYQTLRYLVEQIHRLDIQTNMVLGLDECTRRLSDFSRIDEKFHQTHHALIGMMHASVDDIDKLISYNGEIAPIVDSSKKTLSKVEALAQDFIGSQLLTVGYVNSLEIVRLKLLQERGVITREKAFKKFLHFTMNEIDVVSSLIVNYAYHVFGGVDSLRGILFKKGIASSSKENVLHQVFNGAIDLIFPTLVNKIQSMTNPELSHLVPVFATRDERLAELHSLSNSILKLDNNESGISFSLVEGAFSSKQKLCWTKNQIDEFRAIHNEDVLSRWKSSIKEKGQSAEHLIPKVIELEQKVLALL